MGYELPVEKDMMQVNLTHSGDREKGKGSNISHPGQGFG
jgi:hypothetical protein